MLSDLDFLIAQNNAKPTEPPIALISEYVHFNRVMPPGSPRPGPLDVNYIPYMVEIMDAMGPYSGVNIITVCKGVQTGATANCAENVIAYYMDANPAEILYATATDALLEKWTKRLEPLITSCGFRHKIVRQDVENAKSRKTADKMYSKEYAGGSLSMTSLQSPAGLRSESKRIVIVDEIDGAPAKLTTGEGSPLFILHGRAAAFGTRSKFMEFSTPGTFEQSVIQPRYEAGDQRKYFVPCPHCGEFQVLAFAQLRPEYTGDMLEVVWYECKSCKDQIHNHHKTEMLQAGEWRATAKPRSKSHRSYHISTLYSPVGMMSWTGIYQKYLDAQADQMQMPSFVNLYLGEAYKEEGSRPAMSKIISLRGNYEEGTVPPGVIYLAMAADVQRGAVKYQEMTPEELVEEIDRMKAAGRDLWKSKLPRIEFEVLGIGLHYRSWSVDYRVLYGHTTQGAYQGAFEELQKFGETGMSYRRADGMVFQPQIVLIDATDGVTQPTVFDFCERFGVSTYPTINTDWLKLKQDPHLDSETARTRDRYRIEHKDKSGPQHVAISTNYYKKTLYTRLNIPRQAVDPQRPAFCEFPRNRPDYYFEMLTAEEMRTDGSFYNGGRAAEALDCRVYALCAADVWLEAEVRAAQQQAKKKGYSDMDVGRHDKKWVLAQIQAQIDNRQQIA